jgi:hypothetical protein
LNDAAAHEAKADYGFTHLNLWVLQSPLELDASFVGAFLSVDRHTIRFKARL